MGLIGFGAKILILLVVVVVLLSFIWPYVEPLLPGIRSTTTGMVTAVRSLT